MISREWFDSMGNPEKFSHNPWDCYIGDQVSGHILVNTNYMMCVEILGKITIFLLPFPGFCMG